MKEFIKSIFFWFFTFRATQRMARNTAHQIHPRPFEVFCRNRFNGWFRGVEVGVFDGRHAVSLCKTLHPAKLYLVDPYRTYDDSQMTGAHVEAIFEVARRRVKGLPVEFLRCPSVEADLNSLDFIYIDGDHRYEAVKADLEHWWPRLNQNGVMGGHDFGTGWDGVVQAVAGFAIKNNLKIQCIAPDWWIVKS